MCYLPLYPLVLSQFMYTLFFPCMGIMYDLLQMLIGTSGICNLKSVRDMPAASYIQSNSCSHFVCCLHTTRWPWVQWEWVGGHIDLPLFLLYGIRIAFALTLKNIKHFVLPTYHDLHFRNSELKSGQTMKLLSLGHRLYSFKLF